MSYTQTGPRVPNHCGFPQRFWPVLAEGCETSLLEPFVETFDNAIAAPGLHGLCQVVQFYGAEFPEGPVMGPPLVRLLVHKLHSHPFAKYGYIFTYIYTYPLSYINQLSHFRRQPYSIVSFFLIGFSGLNSSVCCGFARGQRDLGTELCRKVARRNTSKLEMKTNQKHNNVTPNFINYIFGVC